MDARNEILFFGQSVLDSLSCADQFFDYNFENCIVRVEDLVDEEDTPDLFDNCIPCQPSQGEGNNVMLFKNPSEGDYTLDSLSIADGFGKKRPSKKIKPWQTAIFWRVAWLLSKITGKEPLLSKHSARSAHSISNYSSEKIENSLGIQFKKIEAVIQRVCENYPTNQA